MTNDEAVDVLLGLPDREQQRKHLERLFQMIREAPTVEVRNWIFAEPGMERHEMTFIIPRIRP